MTGRDDVLISAGDLMRWLAAGERPVLLDVRWRLDHPDGYPDYLNGHLPGAVYVSLEDELSDHSVTGRGRHPLPSGSALQNAASVACLLVSTDTLIANLPEKEEEGHDHHDHEDF